ncbi:MAG: GWxTD domain-containing protein [Longimicrobiales bacterium]
MIEMSLAVYRSSVVRAVHWLFIATAWVGCVSSPAGQSRTGESPAIARPLEIYQQLGFLAGPPEFPVVASFATMAGPLDSTFVLIGVSLPASALRFQRDGSGFRGEYQISVSFLIDSVTVKRVERRENVRVGSFAETGRVDESIIFQDVIALWPGKYQVQVQASDASSSRGFRGSDTVEVPAYGAQRRLGAPVLVYEAEGRENRDARPDFIVNARKTVAFGAEVPRVYVELYNASAPQTVQFRIVDDRGAAVWQDEALVEAGNERLRHILFDIPTDSLPLGRLWLEASTAGTSAEIIRSPLLVTISDQWMVANFEEVLRFVTYIAHAAELDSLRSASGPARRERWDEFWRRRDPLPATPINEFREEFFQRVRFATEHFGEAGRAGWETDRGEVYVVLGAPDHTTTRQVGRDASARPNAIEWLYQNAPGGRLQLLFMDRAGFGRYDLTPQSEQAFRSTALRQRPRGPGPRP